MKNSFAFTLLGQTCLFVALLLGSGCSKENDPAPAVPSCRIVKSSVESSASNLTARYTYDPQNRLIELVTDNDTKRQSTVSYEYNQKGQLGKYVTQNYRYDAGSNETVTTRTYTFAYNEKGQVSGYQSATISTDPATLQTTSTSTFEYDSQGNRTKITTQTGSSAPNVELYEYQDGNCIRTILRPGESNEFTITYEYYLDRENKFRTLPHAGVFGASASKHMIKKTTQTPANNPDYISVSERTYEFNDKGFPVKTTVTTTSGSSNTFTSVSTNEYACQ